jgi:hypothetical protein
MIRMKVAPKFCITSLFPSSFDNRSVMRQFSGPKLQSLPRNLRIKNRKEEQDGSC